MKSELPDDPKRPRRDDDETVDDAAEDDEDDEEPQESDRDDRAFGDELENADDFEPTLDVPLPVTQKRSRKTGRAGR